MCGRETLTNISWCSLLVKDKKQTICSTCESRLDMVYGVTCEGCGRPMDSFEQVVICADCQKWEMGANNLQKNIACYTYNEFAKELMTLYKYRGDYAIAGVFSEQLQKQWGLVKKDVTIPLPISPERRKERGFNQTEGLLRLAGIPFEITLRREHTEKQSKKTRKERMGQEQFFFVENKEHIDSKEILLVDDIYTTGTTIHLAADALMEAGAKSVFSLTIFR
ncbi:competence protein ComFC [Listeria rocourtiae]|uniref:Competence protein ComFC n=3 Tax=Listeria rocourtiae TaxID=647910 RepID=A0A4R6ZJC3_9LIST|nr:competence protein ComFC [Listeria rocourtiae]